jgi:hypothetical protein
MATSYTPQGRAVLGPGLAIDYGVWSCTDTSTMTITVAGGLILAAAFYDANQNLCCNAGTTITATLSAKSLSSTTGCTTYTLTPSNSTVTNGTYWILHGGA